MGGLVQAETHLDGADINGTVDEVVPNLHFRMIRQYFARNAHVSRGRDADDKGTVPFEPRLMRAASWFNDGKREPTGGCSVLGS